MVDYSIVATYASSAVHSFALLSGGKTFCYVDDESNLIDASAPALVIGSLTGLKLSSTSVVGGKTCTGTLTLSHPAPDGGLAISLLSSSSIAVVPTTVTVPAGATLATFTITTAAVKSAREAKVSAACGTISKSVTLAIKP